VSHYSALKDNYFNAIIVAAMTLPPVSTDGLKENQSKSAQSELSEFKNFENLRFLFAYRSQYGDYLSIAETFLAENNYSEALATLTQMPENFKHTEEQISEITALRTYTQWLQQLEEQGNSIYTLSENELEYLVNYTETHTGRGVVFAKNILCELYGICKEDEIIRRLDDKMITLPSVSTDGQKENQSKSAQSESSEFKINALENIKIFPNPTTGELRIESSKFKVRSVEILDIYGRKIMHSSTEAEPQPSVQSFNPSVPQSLNISVLHSGIYFVKIITDVGVVVKKVVKQ